MLHTVRYHLARLVHASRTLGLGPTLRRCLRWCFDPEARAVDSGFDARYGTDTGGHLAPGHLALPIARRATATMYLPTMDGELQAMLGALPWSVAHRRHATFVDLGSGKGRVVLLAAMERFRAVVGVELSPILHAVAQRNLARVRAARPGLAPVELVCGDATEFAPPAGPIVLFLYHPFAEAIAEQVMDRLRSSLAGAPRPVAILYGHPTLQPRFRDRLFATGGMFELEVRGGRPTRHGVIGWSVWTNRAWLVERALFTRAADAADAAPYAGAR